MRKWLIGIGVAVLGAALGVGAAYGGSELLKTYRPQLVQAVQSIRGSEEWGSDYPMMGVNRRSSRITKGSDGCNGFSETGQTCQGTEGGRKTGGISRGQSDRISLEDAAKVAEDYAFRLGSGFKVAEVMEFDRNFYAVIIEQETGRGAVEVLIDPYTGSVSPEMGPNRMWNTKYGAPMHRSSSVSENELSIEAARDAAQKYLDQNLPGAKLDEGGYAFYGYYTFDYSVDGRTAGMLSVHGSTGEIWAHTWHGAFVAEKEME